jgi:hypothetical protein
MRRGSPGRSGGPFWQRPQISCDRLRSCAERRTQLGEDARSSAFPAPPPETVRIVAIRVDFLKDSADLETTGDGRFDLRPAEDAKIPVDPPPHNRAFFEGQFEALRRYYDIQTHGSLVLEYDVFPQEPELAFHLPDTRRYDLGLSVSNDSIYASRPIHPGEL